MGWCRDSYGYMRKNGAVWKIDWIVGLEVTKHSVFKLRAETRLLETEVGDVRAEEQRVKARLDSSRYKIAGMLANGVN